MGNADQLRNNTIRSSCRACEAAFGCEAVVKSDDAVFQKNLALRFYDCFAAERSLASSTAATEPNVGFASGYRFQLNFDEKKPAQCG